jgi:hypothetical protein
VTARTFLRSASYQRLHIRQSQRSERTLRLLQSKQSQQRRRNIAQRAFLFTLFSVFVVRERECPLGILRSRDDERDFVGRMRRVWGARVQVDHLFCVAVIGRYDEGVACLLARFVDRANGCVCVSDGFDGSVKDTRMPDLCKPRASNINSLTQSVKGGRASRKWYGNGARTISGGAKLHITKSCLSARTTSAT